MMFIIVFMHKTLVGWASNGQAAGTAGYGYRLEALEVVLVPKGQPAPGSTANAFYNLNGEPSVQYRTHVQDIGWQNFVSDGQTSGTTGQGKRLEATTIQLGTRMLPHQVVFSIKRKFKISDGKTGYRTGLCQALRANPCA